MIRFLALGTLLLGLSAFAQDGQTEEQKCQMKCSEGMRTCMMPCMGSDPKESVKPENRNKTMACVRKCSDAQMPCMNQCGALNKKKK